MRTVRVIGIVSRHQTANPDMPSPFTLNHRPISRIAFINRSDTPFEPRGAAEEPPRPTAQLRSDPPQPRRRSPIPPICARSPAPDRQKWVRNPHFSRSPEMPLMRIDRASRPDRQTPRSHTLPRSSAAEPREPGRKTCAKDPERYTAGRKTYV